MIHPRLDRLLTYVAPDLFLPLTYVIPDLQENVSLESRVSLGGSRLAKLREDHEELETRVLLERGEMEQERKVHAQVHTTLLGAKCLLVHSTLCS